MYIYIYIYIHIYFYLNFLVVEHWKSQPIIMIFNIYNVQEDF